MVRKLFSNNFKNNIKRLLKKFKSSSYKQIDSKQSYYSHHNEYSSEKALTLEIDIHKQKTINTKNKSKSNSDIYRTSNSVGNYLDTNQDIKNLIDIGSGTGWFVNYVEKEYSFIKNIVAIEPSEAAIEISKKIYGKKSKITYSNDFAYNALNNIAKDLYIITTNVVFLHLPNRHTKKILKRINQICLSGSVIIFNEPIGSSFLNNYFLHYAKSKSFWSKSLKNFKINFDENKLVYGVKI